MIQVERIDRMKEKERWPLMFGARSTTPVHDHDPRPVLGRPSVMFRDRALRPEQARGLRVVRGKNQHDLSARDGEGVANGHTMQGHPSDLRPRSRSVGLGEYD